MDQFECGSAEPSRARLPVRGTLAATGRVDYVGIPKGNEDEHCAFTAGLRTDQHGGENRPPVTIQRAVGRDQPYHAVFVQSRGDRHRDPGVGKFLDRVSLPSTGGVHAGKSLSDE